MEKEIAVRFYENQKYGSTFGKGLFRTALFNATADLSQPKSKYLLDLYKFEQWQHTAKTDEDMRVLAMAESMVGDANGDDLLATWIKRRDADGSKPYVFGFGLLDLSTHRFLLLINDTETGLQETWALDVKPCKQSTANKNSPQLLATNTDLG